MNVNLGAPYEAKLRRIIEKGYAGNQTEAIRQAITVLDRQIEEEEAHLVHKAVELEMREIDAGRAKTYTWDEVKKKAGLK